MKIIGIICINLGNALSVMYNVICAMRNTYSITCMNMYSEDLSPDLLDVEILAGNIARRFRQDLKTENRVTAAQASKGRFLRRETLCTSSAGN